MDMVGMLSELGQSLLHYSHVQPAYRSLLCPGRSLLELLSVVAVAERTRLIRPGEYVSTASLSPYLENLSYDRLYVLELGTQKLIRRHTRRVSLLH